MTDGGVVKGSVLAPAGIDVGDLFVAASRGDCRPLWTRIQADGTYELAGMTPGSWHVEGRLKEPAVTTIAIAQTPEEKEYNWNVEVVDRRDVTFDIDMRGQGDVALHGRFLIDGEPAEGWRVMLQRKDDRYSGDAVPAAVVDESGGFVLSTRAGRAELTLLGELEGVARVEFVRIIELEGTRVDWEGEITTGPISETVEASIEEVRIQFGQGWSGDRTSTYFAPNAEGRVEGRAPVGSGHLEHPLMTANFGRVWKRIRPIEVRR